MKKYKIADIVVNMNPHFDPFLSQSVPYECNNDEKPISEIEIKDEHYDILRSKNPGISDENLEYLYSGNIFYMILLKFKGMMLHASAVMLDNEAYLFSALCGTGKSTHTSLWLKEFKGAEILNDDKPAIRILDNKAFAYGTPWSGKTNLNINTKVHLKGICFIERGEKNEIRRATELEAITHILDQTVRPFSKEPMEVLLSNLDEIIKVTPVYIMKCNMDPEAAHISYEAISKGELL